MTQSDQLLTDFRRYADLVAARLRGARIPEPTVEMAGSLQVERGAMLAATVRGDVIDPRAVDRLVEFSVMPEALPEVAFIDAAGHTRPVYRPLMIYAWLMSYRIAYEALPRNREASNEFQQVFKLNPDHPLALRFRRGYAV